MDKPFWEVFVSHSTSGKDCVNGVARNLRDKLRPALSPTYEVHVDATGIHVGDKWEPWIHKTLDRSQIGIVLLDTHAASKSKWVKRESTLLSARPSVESVIAVLIGITRRDITEKYPDFDFLKDRQMIDAAECTTEADIEREADRVLGLITDRLRQATDGMPTADVTMTRALSYTFDLYDDEVDSITERFFAEQLKTRGDRPLFPNQWLAKFIIDDQLGESALGAIEDVTFKLDRADHAVRILLSSWILWSEAMPISTERPPPPDPRTPVLLTDDPHVAERYVARAYGCARSQINTERFDPSANGEQTPAQVVAELFSGVRGKGCARAHDNTCAKHALRPQHVLMSAPGGIESAAQVIKAIHERCPSTVVILMVKPDDYAKFDDAGMDELLGAAYRPIERIDAERERRFHDNQAHIRDVVKNSGGSW
ncbi:toll/interleukin-1 receptor domain-containing protein [Actinokineospora sp. HUAS TT18]|uniref:toll/interleukin-1 receptor domain-containing protein n=1 Tax=Actinokineospora sp. HUAS TT18 TaxID=3447451 RepID=UPI003F526228